MNRNMTSHKTNIFPDFEEYIHQGEPTKQQKAYNWQTAIGLQAVDGLQTSDYLLETARQHIEGEIDIEQAQELLRTYYQSKAGRTPKDERTEEADRVSANIAKVLSTQTLAFNANGYVAVHRQIFAGVFKNAGQIRNYDITKREWVLRGDTVNYLNYEDLRRAIEYDIQQEKAFDYRGLTKEEVAAHIARFVSGLWQIHPFGEGNTRATAVFTIQYLRSIGFTVNNDLFARHSWYFRNALVRANYKNVRRGINYEYKFLERFFRNLLLGERNELKNRFLVIDAPDGWSVDRPSADQVPTKYRPSSDEVDKGLRQLLAVLADEQKSVKGMMEVLGLKHRRTFVVNYLEPAMRQGLVRMLYPNSPKHPRQKYLLTPQGMALYNQFKR